MSLLTGFHLFPVGLGSAPSRFRPLRGRAFTRPWDESQHRGPRVPFCVSLRPVPCTPSTVTVQPQSHWSWWSDIGLKLVQHDCRDLGTSGGNYWQMVTHTI